MITERQIKEKLGDEKDPIQYLDGELSRRASQMGDRCENIQDTISTYNRRASDNEVIDLEKIKEELKSIGELYLEMGTYLKVRKAQVKNQKRMEQLNEAQARHQKWIEQKQKGSE